jgi:cation/acetate symporter
MALELNSAEVRARLTTLLCVFACAVAAALALLLLLKHSRPASQGIDAGFFALGLAAAVAVAVFARMLAAGQSEPGALAAPAVYRGLALATDTVSAVFFLGVTGAVFTWGHDGLAFALGLGAGFLLLQLLVAPVLPQMGTGSVPEFFALRYGRVPRLLAALVVVVSMVILLVAQLMAAGLVGARLLGLEFAGAVAVAGGALIVCFVLRGMAGTAWVRAILFPLMLLAFLAPAVQLSAEWYGLPVPQFAYANTLWQIQGLEETLLEQDLADPAVMKPMLTPFLSLNPLNFLGLVLGLAVGTASLPNVLSRHLMVEPVRAARWSAVWGLFFAALLLTAAPALAAYAKRAVLTLIADRTDLASLPAWIFTYGKLGLVEVCGRAATDAAAVAAACAEVPDASGVLRLQDLTLQPDMIALAAPEIAGLGHAMFGLLAAAALAAALVTSDGPLFAIAAAFGWDARAARGAASGAVARLAPYAIAAAAVVGAGFAAATRPAAILTVATWAFTLAACGLFPALIAGLWWRRASASAAAVAIFAGVAVCLFYLVGTRYFAVGFFETWQSLSSAGPTARETFAELKQAWASSEPGAAKDAAWAVLDAHAQGIANWWGVKNLATALLALPVGIVAMVTVSLVVPRRLAAETAS